MWVLLTLINAYCYLEQSVCSFVVTILFEVTSRTEHLKTKLDATNVHVTQAWELPNPQGI